MKLEHKVDNETKEFILQVLDKVQGIVNSIKNIEISIKVDKKTNE